MRLDLWKVVFLESEWKHLRSAWLFLNHQYGGVQHAFAEQTQFRKLLPMETVLCPYQHGPLRLLHKHELLQWVDQGLWMSLDPWNLKMQIVLFLLWNTIPGRMQILHFSKLHQQWKLFLEQQLLQYFPCNNRVLLTSGCWVMSKQNFTKRIEMFGKFYQGKRRNQIRKLWKPQMFKPKCSRMLEQAIQFRMFLEYNQLQKSFMRLK